MVDELANMNDVPFGVYGQGVIWSSNHCPDTKVETASISNCTGYSAGLMNYTNFHNTSHYNEQYGQRSVQQLVSGQIQHDSYSPSYYNGMMDFHTTDDFESFTRERCHTWPGIQQRPLDSFTGSEQQQINPDNQHQQQQFSPPPLPSRGSSGLSLISESNESLLTTPLAETDTKDWTSPGGVGYSPISDYSASGPNAHHLQPTPTTTTSSSAPPAQTTGAASKRSVTATPSYKSGHPSYVELITQAILSSPEKRMTLSEIYDWMVANVPSFKDQRHLHSSAGWKNSVRHNLSLHARFKRVKRNGMDKPSWWTVDLSEETKRERSKRPRQSRPRANTTTAAFQSQRQQQQRPAPVQSQGRPSLGFAQPQPPSLSDRASSGRGSLSFSGSVTPASSIGSDIFLVGTASYSGANSSPFNFLQQSSLPQESTMPPAAASQLLISDQYYGVASMDGSMAEESMGWAQYSGSAPVRISDHMFDGGQSIAESTNLQCLSQAITVSLSDPTAAPTDSMKQEVMNISDSGSAPISDIDGIANYYGTTLGSVSTLVHALRQNTLDETNNLASASPLRQMLQVQANGGQVQEMNCPTSLSSQSPMASMMQQQQFHQNLTLGDGTSQHLSPNYQQQQNMASPSPVQRQICPSPYEQTTNLKKAHAPAVAVNNQLPDDLAALDVGGLDCNIMDVISFEMNCSNANTNGFV